jgi:hypothetical protein
MNVLKRSGHGREVGSLFDLEAKPVFSRRHTVSAEKGIPGSRRKFTKYWERQNQPE